MIDERESLTRGALVAIGAAAAASLVMAVSFLGAWSPALDLLAHFRVQATLVCTALAALLLARRRTRIAALLPAVAAVAGALSIVPLYVPSSATAAPAASRLTVFAHNTWGRSTETGRVLDQVRSSGAQLVFLQEMSATLRPAVSALDDTFEVLAHRENALLVRRDDGDAFAVDVAQPWSEDAWLGFDVRARLDGRPLRILAVHLSSPRTARGLERRDRQIEAIARWSSSSRDPQLVVGDLNTTPWAHGFRDLLRSTRLEDSTRGFGIQPTYPTFGPAGLSVLLRIPIDHALHTPELVTLERSIGAKAASNHRPVRVVLAWRSGAASAHGALE